MTKTGVVKNVFSEQLCAFALVIGGFGPDIRRLFLHLTLIGVANRAASG
jgi:hypothetical protein